MFHKNFLRFFFIPAWTIHWCTITQILHIHDFPNSLINMTLTLIQPCNAALLYAFTFVIAISWFEYWFKIWLNMLKVILNQFLPMVSFIFYLCPLNISIAQKDFWRRNWIKKTAHKFGWKRQQSSVPSQVHGSPETNSKPDWNTRLRVKYETYFFAADANLPQCHPVTEKYLFPPVRRPNYYIADCCALVAGIIPFIVESHLVNFMIAEKGQVW